MKRFILILAVVVAFLGGLSLALKGDESGDDLVQEYPDPASETSSRATVRATPYVGLAQAEPTPIREQPVDFGLCHAPDQSIKWRGAPVLETANICVIISDVDVDPPPVFAMINAVAGETRSVVEVYRDLKDQAEEAICADSRIEDPYMFRLFWTPSPNVAPLLTDSDRTFQMDCER